MQHPSYILLISCLLLVACNRQNNVGNPICMNQLGFAPHQEKTATIDVHSLDEPPCKAFILNTTGDTVWSGTASPTMPNPVSGKPRQIVDFSSLTAKGEYTLYVANDEMSTINCQFSIGDRPYRELTRAALRAFYHQRASMPTEEPFAEGYARPAGHPDDHVLVHPSAATDERPAGTVISSPGGWYDAGDYNKYIVNSGFTMGVWLMAYELNKAYFDTLNLNIPESQTINHKFETINHKFETINHKFETINHCPDMLSEAMYNLR